MLNFDEIYRTALDFGYGEGLAFVTPKQLGLLGKNPLIRILNEAEKYGLIPVQCTTKNYEWCAKNWENIPKYYWVNPNNGVVWNHHSIVFTKEFSERKERLVEMIMDPNGEPEKESTYVNTWNPIGEDQVLVFRCE